MTITTAPTLSFSLGATGSSAWFVRLGQGLTRMALPGTWAGTVTVEKQTPGGNTVVLTGPSGSPVSYTADSGEIVTDDPGPLRFTFTRTSGTVTPEAWSDQSQLRTLS